MEKQESTKTMSATELTAMLSQTMRDVTDRKTSIRKAMAISRIALALAKVIETTNLQERVELIEQMLKKRK